MYWRYPTALLCSVVASFVIGLLSRGVVEIMDLAMYDYDAALCDTTGFSAFVEAALYSIPDVCFVYLPCVLLLLGDVWPALSIAGRVKEVPAMGGAVVVVEDARIPRQPVPVPAPVNAPPREPVSVASLFGGYPSSLRLRVPLACAFGFAGIGLLLACYVGAFHNRPAWMKSSVHVPWVFGTARAAAALCTLCLVILLLSVHRIPLNTAYASFLGFGLVQLPADVQELPWLLRKLHSCVKDVHRKMGKVVAGLACVHIISHNWLAYDKLPKAPAVYASPRALNGGHGVAGITGWLMVLCLIVIIVSGTQRWRSWHAFHRPTVLAFLLLYSFHGTGWEFDVFPYNGVVMGSVAWLTIASAVVFRYVFSPSTIRAVKVAVAGNIVLFRATVDETVPVAAAWAVAVGEEQSHTHDFSGVTDFDPCDPHAIEFHLSVTTKRSLVRQLPCTGTKCPCATCPSGTPCAERRCGRCHRHLRAKVPPAPAHIPPLPGVHAELPCKCPCACHELEVCPEVLANCRLKFKDVGDIPDLSAFTLRGPILGPISTALRELVGNHESKVKAVYLVAMGVGITPMLSFILRLLATLARLAADAPEVERLKKLKIRVLWVSQVPDHVEHVLTLFHQVLPRFALHPDIRIVIVAKRPSRAGPGGPPVPKSIPDPRTWTSRIYNSVVAVFGRNGPGVGFVDGPAPPRVLVGGGVECALSLPKAVCWASCPVPTCWGESPWHFSPFDGVFGPSPCCRIPPQLRT